MHHGDIAILERPTENKLAVGHKGILLFDVEVFGKGVALRIPRVGRFGHRGSCSALGQFARAWNSPRPDILGPSTLNIGKIEAGVAANVVPAYAKATIAIRVADDLARVVHLVRSVVEDTPHVGPFSFFGTEPQFSGLRRPWLWHFGLQLTPLTCLISAFL